MANDSTPPRQTEIIRDVMDPARGQALQVALGMPVTVAAGAPLPPFFHQIHFWAPEPPDRLGRDGHPQTGLGLIPDLGLPRRMWAGGRLGFHAVLRAGMTAERHTSVLRVDRKDGRTGPLGFVTLLHQVWQDGALCLTEEQDLVYRADPGPAAQHPVPPVARTDADVTEVARFNPTLLFRYSALTMNGHRIHYDTDYARGIEGYAGLVPHGPLLAQLLMLLAQRQGGPLRAFDFKATAPATVDEAVTLCWRTDGALWVAGQDGRQCMTAQARFGAS